MATVGTRVTFTFVDPNKRETKTTLFFPVSVVTPNDSHIVAIAAELQACSTNTLKEVSISQDGDQVASATANAYSSCQDKALLQMDNAAGQASNWKLPAPIATTPTIFESDNVTVDPTSTLIANFVTAVVNYVCTQGGTGFADGTLVGHRL